MDLTIFIKDILKPKPEKVITKGQPERGAFAVMLRKETTDHIRSWRFIVLVALIVLTFIAAIYTSLSNIKPTGAMFPNPDQNFLYLKLLTVTDNTIPPFHIFLSFLAPLLGIGLGFDAINSEKNNGTLIRLMAQPVYRDNLLLAKFSSALLIISSLFIVLALLMIGAGLILTGVRMEPDEVLRITGFVFVTITYVAFWLALSMTLSIVFKQAATSAITCIGLWLFFTVFYQILVNVALRSLLPDAAQLTQEQAIAYNDVVLNILRISPNQLYTDAVTTLLMPSVRSLGPLTMEQMAGAIPSPLPFTQSLLVVWPQFSGLLASVTCCFGLAYYLFMRREIRS
ncbi:ABC transporter permease [Mucilaginibacter sp. SMC90]|uniref:ABC transporter permease n=1 Tax=Mucilaginibacter sp. SMC90 TaxID=2929803 RepID=UPI001FB20E1A|nr:ABC transporter permease subunit [Mucilaginibacter sp. SMC90]UOE49396.1 ABC transporter permease [Mucilaginibacter sp. SMC90]